MYVVVGVWCLSGFGGAVGAMDSVSDFESGGCGFESRIAYSFATATNQTPNTPNTQYTHHTHTVRVNANQIDHASDKHSHTHTHTHTQNTHTHNTHNTQTREWLMVNG